MGYKTTYSPALLYLSLCEQERGGWRWSFQKERGHDDEYYETWSSSSVFLVVVKKKKKREAPFFPSTLYINSPQIVPESSVGTLTWLFLLLHYSWKAGFFGREAGRAWRWDLGLCKWAPQGRGRREERWSVGQRLYCKLTGLQRLEGWKNVSYE